MVTDSSTPVNLPPLEPVSDPPEPIFNLDYAENFAVVPSRTRQSHLWAFANAEAILKQKGVSRHR